MLKITGNINVNDGVADVDLAGAEAVLFAYVTEEPDRPGVGRYRGGVLAERPMDVVEMLRSLLVSIMGADENGQAIIGEAYGRALHQFMSGEILDTGILKRLTPDGTELEKPDWIPKPPSDPNAN